MFPASEAGFRSVDQSLDQAACALARAEHAVKAAAIIVAATRLPRGNNHVDGVLVGRIHFEERGHL